MAARLHRGTVAGSVRTNYWWSGVLLVILCGLVESTDRNSESCTHVKQAYGAKGFNQHEVPHTMIAGEMMIMMKMQINSLLVR